MNMINSKQSSDSVSLAELKKRIEQLERSLQQSAEHSNRPNTYHITIERMEIHQPKLDSLTFSLDALDIRELSGVLNLGNNFGGSGPTHPADSKERPSEKQLHALANPKLRRNMPVSIIPVRSK
jgi:hypothetical protein